MLSADSAYQQAMDNLRVILGGEKFSVDTAEKVNGQVCFSTCSLSCQMLLAISPMTSTWEGIPDQRMRKRS